MSKKSSPCLYMVIGCGIAVVLAIAVLVGGGLFLAKKGQEFAEEMSDPVARSEKVKEVLGAEQLPEGYYPMISISIPFAFEMAMLSDRPGEGPEPQGIDESGFIYLDGRMFGAKRQNLIDYLEGKTDDFDMLDDTSIDFDSSQSLRRGSFEIEGRRHLYAAYRGEVDTGEQTFEGLQVLTYIECEDPRVRLGIWFGPDPMDEVATDGELPLELTGTPADEAVLIEFYRAFRPCA